MPFLILDLETVLDPTLPRPPAPEDGKPVMLAPPYHAIAVAGSMMVDDNYRVMGWRSDIEERGAVTQLVEAISGEDVCVVTFAGRQFDMPVLVARCLHLGIPFPRYYARTREQPDMRYKFAAYPHLDLMDFLSDHGAALRGRLDTYAKLCGWPGKGEVDGGDVAGMPRAGKVQEVQAYNIEDLFNTAAIFLRVQLLRGVLGREGYGLAMTDLIAAAEQEPMLNLFATRIHRPLALLVPGG